MFLLSSSEEVDIGNAGEIVPSLSPQYEELVEVITHAVAKLSLDWPAERFIEPQRGKLDECFLRFKMSSSHARACLFSQPHTEVSRSWRRYTIRGKRYKNVNFIPTKNT